MSEPNVLNEERERIGSGWGRGIDPMRFPAVKKFAGETVLDVGCGSGAYVEALNNSGRRAVGLDVTYLNAWASIKSCAVVGNASSLPFSGGVFETVLALEVLEHCRDARRCLLEMARVASRNIIISVPDCKVPEECVRAGLVPHHWVDRSHCTLFTEDSIKSDIAAAGLKVAYFTRINATHPEILVLQAWPLMRIFEKPVCMIADWFTVRRIRRPLCGCMLIVAEKPDLMAQQGGG